jgi:hypothetical protein
LLAAFSQKANMGLTLADLMPEGRLGKHLPSSFQLNQQESLPEWQISALLAWVTTEMAEPVRLPLTLVLSPLFRRKLDRWKAKQAEKYP